MSEATQSGLLHYFKRELSYLREQGADFSRRYPKVAARIGLSEAESLDPHTERLIESVAFLTARVHQDLDREFPKIAAALLENVSPSLVQPVPSLSIAQFTLDPSQGKVSSGFPVPRHTPVNTQASNGETCRFRTAWETMLWPISVVQAAMEGGSTLCLELECGPDTVFSELEFDFLRLHLHGDWVVTMPLYEWLASDVERITVTPQGGAPVALPCDAWREVGYAQDEDVLAQPAHAQPAYGLMQEYFAFPRKFHFFDVFGVREKAGACRRVAIRVRFAQPPRNVERLHAAQFLLGCSPIANLFPLTGEPITIDQKHFEYRLVADHRRESSTEVHSILGVTVSDPNAERPLVVPAFAALGRMGPGEGGSFWSARREHSLRPDISGTDMFISFVDRNEQPARLNHPVVYAQLLCTNRRLAEQVPRNARMVAQGISGTANVRCLYEPTSQRTPPLGSETLWRLVSLLTLSHQSLVDGSTGREQLHEMLSLFASDSARDQTQIRGIRNLSARSVTGHIGNEAWRGFCRGTRVTVQLDEEAFAGGSRLMLAAVLARFFGLYTSVNAFVQLQVLRGDEVWKLWKPMSGRQQIL